jgi:hypothetical protein
MIPSAEEQHQNQAATPRIRRQRVEDNGFHQEATLSKSETAGYSKTIAIISVDWWSHYPPRTCLILAGNA